MEEGRAWERESGSKIFHGHPTASTGSEHGITYRLSFIRNIPECADSTLDVGAGYGAYISKIPNSVGLEIATTFFSKRKAELIRGVGETMPIRTRSCGRVFLFEVIEHVNDEARVLQEIRRVLSPGGYLFLTAPNRFYPFETHGFQTSHRSFGNLLSIGIPLLSFFPNFVRRHIERARVYSQKDLVKLLHANGYRVLKSGYMPPPLDKPKQSTIVNSARLVIETISRHPPFKQMGVACLIVAAPMKTERD
jgi:SAM-dependent methyltransferase